MEGIGYQCVTFKKKTSTIKANQPLPYAIKVDSGPAFRTSFEKELSELGVKIIHSSAYHPQSQGQVERSVHTLRCYWTRKDKT